jgi:MYXO-CTERM domain-containing protein
VSRTRRLTVGVAVLALLGAAVPAGASTDSYAAEAASAGLALSLAGNDVLEIGSTFASVVPGEALALAIPVALGGTPIGGREASSEGAEVADPADPAERCLAAVPAPLDALVGAGAACADAVAEGDQPFAAAAAGLAEANVLSLEGEVLEPLAELIATLPLTELVDAVEDQLLEQLEGAFGDVRAACLEALAPLNVGGLLDPVLGPLQEAAPDEVAALLATLDGLLAGAVPAACEVLGELADLLLDGDLLGSVASGALLEQLTGAAGVLDVSLLETEAVAGVEDDEVLAVAGPGDGIVEITVDVPLLDELLGDLLGAVIGPVLVELTALLAPVADAVTAIPELGPVVAELLTSGEVADLLEGPLLSIGVAPGSAAVSGDLTTGDLEGVADAALVDLGGALFSLPVLAGLDDALNELGGLLDETVLAELRASPLREVVSVTLLEEDVEDGEVGGLEGLVATSGAASVELLGALEAEAGAPLLELDVAPASAGVGLTVPVEPSGPDPTPATPSPTPASLPVTGGGAAFVGLLALGAAAALRRRD